MLAETANLAVKLSLTGNFASQLGKVNRSLSTFDKNASRAYRAGEQIGTGLKRGAVLAATGAGILAFNVKQGLDSLVELEKATAQTEAVIKSTGNAAGITAEQVRTLAERYEALNATIGDETIQAGENLLLTFTKIGNQAFEPALKAALDLSVALGTDLDSAIKTVGKALSEPEKAMARLRRQGIILTDAEERQVKAHLKNNDALGAQEVILAALDKRYGGSFLAGGTTTAGKVAKFTDSIEDLQRALATALLPAVGNIADALTEFLSDPATIRDVKRLGEEIGKLFSRENITKGIQLLKDAVGTIRAIAGPIADVIGTAVKAFTSLPPDIQKLLVGGFAVNKLTGGLVTNIAGGIFGALKAMTVQAAVVNVTGGVVNNGGVPGVPGKGGGAAPVGKGVPAWVKGIGALSLGGALFIAATEVSGINDPKHQITDPKTGQDRTFRGSNDVTDQLRNIDAGIKQLSTRTDPVAQKQLAALISLRDKLTAQPEKSDEEETLRETKKGFAFLDAKISKLNVTTGKKGDATKSATDKVKSAQVETKRETAKGAAFMGGVTRSTTAAQTGALVSAIYGARPIVTVNVSGNSVTTTNNRTGRYGKKNGSRNQDAFDGERPR